MSIRPSSLRPSVCLSVNASFLCSNFSTFWPIFFKLCRHWYWGGVVWDCKWSNFVLKQQSYGPWCMSKMLCASFPCSNFSTFLPIFFKLCTDIGIGEEWYGIASGIISFRNNRVMALDSCPKCVFAQCLKNEQTNFNKILHMHWYVYIWSVIPSELWVSICPSVHHLSVCLSVSTSFPCSNFSTFWLIFFKLCIDIGIGEEWCGIASGLISFWNNRVMALDVYQKCFALRFRALTLVPFYWFSSNFA